MARTKHFTAAEEKQDLTSGDLHKTGKKQPTTQPQRPFLFVFFFERTGDAGDDMFS